MAAAAFCSGLDLYLLEDLVVKFIVEELSQIFPSLI